MLTPKGMNITRGLEARAPMWYAPYVACHLQCASVHFTRNISYPIGIGT